MSKNIGFFRLLLLKTVLFSLFVSACQPIFAKEGMWLPPILKNREADMKNEGLSIPIERLYNTDGTGLNNAVVLFGKGCTGEIISSKGLLLTNHHCAYGTVQGLSSREHDYFAHGFWAMSNNQELPCPGLTVTFIRRMENVTDKILHGLEDALAGRDSIIAIRIKNLEKGYKVSTGLDAIIKPFYNGNQYWVSIMETFRDVRLVGFPPNGIGAFGGDTDNWMWPRHTGDFSIFRVYAGKDNKPADYSKDNKPYQTSQFFTINTSGVKEGDFSMVYGFPAVTTEYISSYQLNHVFRIIDPVRIEARTKRLDVWSLHMRASRDVFLKYTSKRAGVANGWKKWQGEVRGLKINRVPDLKVNYEEGFQQWANREKSVVYSDNVINEIGARSQAIEKLVRADEYIKEAVLGIELIPQAVALDNMLQAFRSGKTGDALKDTLQKIYRKSLGLYKNYDVATDKDIFIALMPLFMEKNPDYIPAEFSEQYLSRGMDYNQWAAYVFSSRAADSSRLWQTAQSTNRSDSMMIVTDPAWKLYSSITKFRKERISPELSTYNDRMSILNRLYMKAQMVYEPKKEFYPDANQTLRLTYGKIKGIDPDGTSGYAYQTNLNEAVAKHNPDVDEFNMPEKLRQLHAKKDFGKWEVNGTVPIAFTATNHTSGGNSGSPVLNAKGELTGTNFDRIWEGTMSDLYFDEKLCRNISVDIRYTLFIIDKFGGAGWLLKEMKFAGK
jgi:hypothetical protein